MGVRPFLFRDKSALPFGLIICVSFIAEGLTLVKLLVLPIKDGALVLRRGSKSSEFG